MNNHKPDWIFRAVLLGLVTFVVLLLLSPDPEPDRIWVETPVGIVLWDGDSFEAVVDITNPDEADDYLMEWDSDGDTFLWAVGYCADGSTVRMECEP